MTSKTSSLHAWNRLVSGVMVSSAAILTLAGCVQAPTEEPIEDVAVPSEVVEEAVPEVVVDIPEGVDPVRVVLAFVLMSTGDIESAVAEGLVTPDEVAIAVQSLEDGTVQEWIDRAEEQASS